MAFGMVWPYVQFVGIVNMMHNWTEEAAQGRQNNKCEVICPFAVFVFKMVLTFHLNKTALHRLQG